MGGESMAEYIEREAVRKHLMSYAGMFTDELGFVVSLQAVLNGIDFQPAADVEPVKHGRLEREHVDEWYTHVYACMECGTRMMLCDEEWRHIAPKVCPTCGVRLDGE